MAFKKILFYFFRFIAVFTLAWSFSAQAQHHSQTSQTDDFLEAFKLVVDRMLENYRNEVTGHALFAEVLVETEEVNQFLLSVTANAPAMSKSHPISLMYLPDSRVNGEQGSTCFIRYNPKKRNDLVFGYDRIMTKAEIVYYIAVHEFGHCMAFHQVQIHGTEKLGAKEHELIADKISIAFFAVNNEHDSVKKILHFNSNWIAKDGVHYHGDALAQYYERLKVFLDTKVDDVPVDSMLDIFHLAQL